MAAASSRRAALAVLLALLLGAPVAANGPGPDPGYRYEATTVTDAGVETARALTAHPDIAGGFAAGKPWRVARNATNTTYRHPVDDLHPDVRALTDATAVVGPFGDAVYAVDARVENSFLLDARRLPSVEAAARRVAVPPSEVAPPLRRAAEGERVTGQQHYEVVVVRRDDGPVLVTSEPASVPDPFRWPKLVGSALAVGLVAFAGIEARRG